MRWLLISASLIAICPALPARADDSAESKEYKALSGEWDRTAIEEASGARTFQHLTAKFSGNQVDLVRKDGTIASRYSVTVDPTKVPKTMDFTRRGGNTDGRKSLAISKIEDGVFTFVMSGSFGDESNRPTSFDMSRESNSVKYTYKRIDKVSR